MRTKFDQVAKQLLCESLVSAGIATTDAEVNHDVQRIDVLFELDPARRAALANLGLLGKLALGTTLFEPFHKTPGVRTIVGCLRKVLAFDHALVRRAGEKRRSGSRPRMWVLSAGPPDRGLRALRFRPFRRWGRGIYLAPPALRLGLVVLSELDLSPETLLFRLMGAGKVLRDAIAELAALPASNPIRLLALPILVDFRFEIPADPSERTPEEQEFVMSTREIVEAWRREALEQGREQGREQGIGLGFAKGLTKVYEARFGTLPPEIRAVLDRTHDEATLQGWFELFSVRSAQEIAAALLGRS
jgi:hypothetical protein